jgi:hypothetical protein
MASKRSGTDMRQILHHGQMDTVVYPDADMTSLYITQVSSDTDQKTANIDSDVLLVPIIDLPQFEAAIRVVANKVKKHLLSQGVSLKRHMAKKR